MQSGGGGGGGGGREDWNWEPLVYREKKSFKNKIHIADLWLGKSFFTWIMDLLTNLCLFTANNFEGPEHLQAGLSDGD